MTKRKPPDAAHGHRAYLAGQSAFLAGDDPKSCPHLPARDFAASCLAAAWRRGYNAALQAHLQRAYGDAPQPRKTT